MGAREIFCAPLKTGADARRAFAFLLLGALAIICILAVVSFIGGFLLEHVAFNSPHTLRL